jgi:hypothetical protein
MNPREFYPNLTSRCDPEVERAVRIAFDSIYELRRRLNGTQSANPAQPPAVINQTVQQIMSGSWTGQMPSSVLTLSQINAALSAKGSNPLNVQSLLGVLAQPQIGGAPTVTSLPMPPSPTAQDGALVSLSGVLYRFNGSTSPGFWEALLASGIIAFGTRGAKPGSGAAGTEYFETDTGWLYLGTGAGWTFIAGIDYGTDATRSGIGVAAADNGAIFLTSDTKALWRVVGGAWTQVYVTNVLGQSNLTGQSANLGPTTLATPTVAGNYRVTVYVLCSLGGAGTVDVSVTWTDPSGAQTINPVGTLSLVTTGNFVSADQIIYDNAAAAIAYTTTVAGVVLATYDIHILVEPA